MEQSKSTKVLKPVNVGAKAYATLETPRGEAQGPILLINSKAIQSPVKKKVKEMVKATLRLSLLRNAERQPSVTKLPSINKSPQLRPNVVDVSLETAQSIYRPYVPKDKKTQRSGTKIANFDLHNLL